jgi:transcriptional regulator with XRE-family HTH domain
MTVKSVFVSRLRERRRALGFTQRQLAHAAGNMDERQVSSYEVGKTMPTFENARRLAAALRVPLSYLAGEIDVVEVSELRSLLAARAAEVA